MSIYDDPIIIEGIISKKKKIISYQIEMAARMTANSLWAAAFYSVKSLKAHL